VSSQGVVQAKHDTELVAQVRGEILEIAEVFETGGVVKAGQLLALIDDTDYTAAVSQAEADVLAAKAALEIEKAQGKVARVSRKNRSDQPSALGLRKPQLAQEQAQLAASKASLAIAQKDLQRTRIVAPFDALVGARSVGLGTFAQPGLSIGRLKSIATAQVRLPISVRHMAMLDSFQATGISKGPGVGSIVTLKTQGKGKHGQWLGKIIRNEGIVDERSRMHYLVAEVPCGPTAETVAASTR
jgi:RND family efflux transporter MFP subunit